MTYSHSQRWVRSVFLSLKLQKATCGWVCSNPAECTVRRRWHTLWLQLPSVTYKWRRQWGCAGWPMPLHFPPTACKQHLHFASSSKDTGITQNTGRWGHLWSKSGPLCGCERSVGWWAWLNGQGRTFANIDSVQLVRWVLLCRISFLF